MDIDPARPVSRVTISNLINLYVGGELIGSIEESSIEIGGEIRVLEHVPSGT